MSVAEKLQRKEMRQTTSRQVRLKLVYIDVWSLVKLSFLVWLCLGIVLVVASVLIWVVLASTGIFDTLDQTLRDMIGDENFAIADSFGIAQVLGGTTLIALLNTIVGTALGAVGGFLYNLSVRLTGGLLVGFQNS
jgi:ABC-type phosphate transport system permease subunit